MSFYGLVIMSATVGTGVEGDAFRPQAPEDYPHVEGPGTPTPDDEWVSAGRDSSGNQILKHVTEVAVQEVLVEGIRAWKTDIPPDPGEQSWQPTGIVAGSADSVAASLTLTLGPMNVDTNVLIGKTPVATESAAGLVVNPTLVPDDLDDPYTKVQWDDVRLGLVAVNVSATWLDGWWAGHPEGTPRQLWVALRSNRPFVRP